MEVEKKAVRSNSWIERLVVCTDCGHVAKDQERHKEHLKEARHINTLRNLAYRQATHYTILRHYTSYTILLYMSDGITVLFVFNEGRRTLWLLLTETYYVITSPPITINYSGNSKQLACQIH